MKRYLISLRIVALFLALFSLLSSVKAEDRSAVAKRDSVVRSTSLYFKFDVSSRIDRMDQEEMSDLIFWIKENHKARINICGWADKIGSSEYNIKLSERRAKTATDYLVDKGVEASRIHYVGMGIDPRPVSNQEARRSTIMAVLDLVVEPEPLPIAKPEPKEVVEEVVESTPEPEPQPTPEPAVDIAKERGNLSLRTNLLYLAATSFNLGIEWNPLNSNLGFIINGGYAPFGGDGNKRNLGAAFFSPEVRYYFGEDKHWFAGVEFLAGLYNYKLSDTGYQGSVYAGGFTGGYRIELSKKFDMDFSLGLGFGQLKYDTYYHNGEGNVLIDEDVTKNTVMPIQAGVSLIWKIF